MIRNLRYSPLAVLLSLSLFAVACSDDEPAAPRGTDGAAVPDFSIPDVNPNSATGGQNVSPRDYLRKASAWYFGHAT